MNVLVYNKIKFVQEYVCQINFPYLCVKQNNNFCLTSLLYNIYIYNQINNNECI